MWHQKALQDKQRKTPSAFPEWKTVASNLVICTTKLFEVKGFQRVLFFHSKISNNLRTPLLNIQTSCPPLYISSRCFTSTVSSIIFSYSPFCMAHLCSISICVKIFSKFSYIGSVLQTACTQSSEISVFPLCFPFFLHFLIVDINWRNEHESQMNPSNLPVSTSVLRLR